MKTGVRKVSLYIFDITPRQAALHYSERKIDQIAFSKNLDQGFSARIFSELMMGIDHLSDLRDPYA